MAENLRAAAGMLLVAPPSMEDPNFRRAVILLCEHGETGSFGLILNRPLSLQLGEVLEETAPCDAPLSLGGPVQPNTLHYLHTFGDAAQGAVGIAQGVYWGGDFEYVKTHLRVGAYDATHLRFFLGYAGWGEGQLEGELADEDWIVTPAEPGDVFRRPAEQLWQLVMRRMGGDYALFANFPEDPRMN